MLLRAGNTQKEIAELLEVHSSSICRELKRNCTPFVVYCSCMKQPLYSRIVVKIGTNVITTSDGILNTAILQHLVTQIVILQKRGIEVILVSSGAVGAGRSLIKLQSKVNDVVKRQVLASIGQVQLMQTYLDFFKKQQKVCAQVLVTKEDFRDRVHYLNMKNCFEGLLANGVLPIVNENDVIAVDALMFTDNDELAAFVASLIEADALLILSTVDGIFDRDPEDKNAQLIATVTPGTSLQKYISARKSLFGRGGMLTKAKIGHKMASLGITTYIANGQRLNVLVDLLAGVELGTKFVSNTAYHSSMKCWLATREGYEKGAAWINDGAVNVLKREIASLLPVGILKVVGNFQKGDIISVRNASGEKIGWGIATYSSEVARCSLGQQRKKPLIHYDYLFLKK